MQCVTRVHHRATKRDPIDIPVPTPSKSSLNRTFLFSKILRGNLKFRLRSNIIRVSRMVILFSV